MILLDTSVLVALVDERDRLHALAKRELKRLEKSELGVTSAVLAECLFLLPAVYLRRRLSFLLERVGAVAVHLEFPWWTEVFSWLDEYAEHEPDFADAELVVLSGRDPSHTVWTYDREFRDVWRRPDGSKIPLLGSTRRRAD
jgi:predicted nucleic acid-binding protein